MTKKEDGIPVRLLGARGAAPKPGELFRIVDAMRLDTGRLMKLMGDFPDFRPGQELVIDVTDRLLARTGFEYEYRFTRARAGADQVQAALATKRAEGPKDPAGELPPLFTSVEVVTGGRVLNGLGARNPYRIFLAKIGESSEEVKIVARIPDGEPTGRRMRLALAEDRDQNGEPQFQGIYLGPSGADPEPSVTPDSERASEPGPDRQAGQETTPAPRPAPRRDPYQPPSLADGARRIRPFELISMEATGPEPFSIFRAKDLESGETLRVYANVPDGDLGRDLLFTERTRKPGKSGYELRGTVRVANPESPVAPVRTPVGRIISREVTGDVPTGPERTAPPPSTGTADRTGSAGPKGRMMRIKYAPELNKRDEPYQRVVPRRDGSVQYFYIFRVRDLDTGKAHTVKLYLPDQDYKREMSLLLEPVMEGGYPCMRQSSGHLPLELNGVPFEKMEWERLRVTGQALITKETHGDLDEVYHIFDAVIDGTNHVLKIMGLVPGGDIKRKMTVLVRPKNWRYGELQYEAGLIEPDPNVAPEKMRDLVRKMKAPGLSDVLIPRVVDRFGSSSLYVIRYEPERLLEVQGIGQGTVDQIRTATHLDRNAAILSAMSRTGVHLRYFAGILKLFAEDAVEVIERYPYRLMEVSSISFGYADKIAVKNLGMSDLSEERVAAALRTAVHQLIGQGKSRDWAARVESRVSTLTREVGRSDHALFTERLWDLIRAESGREDGIVQTEQVDGRLMIRFMEAVRAEQQIAKDLHERKTMGPEWGPFSPDRFLRDLQRAGSFSLGAEQVSAIRMVCKNGTSVITGGPGVGKTTTLKAIVGALENAGVHMILTAPTGIAAKRASKSTGRPASTIHSAIARLGQEGEEDPFIPHNCPVCLVMDETSMVNVLTMEKLLRRLPMRVSILFSGDVDQLPSIGPGRILHDLIRSDMLPVSRLQTVYRQGADSEIIAAARAINRKEWPVSGKDFRIIERTGADMIQKEVIARVDALRRTPGFNFMDHLMVLSPIKKGEAGVVALNTELQKLLNPPAPGKAELTVSRPPEIEDEEDDQPLTEEQRRKREEQEKIHRETLRVGDKVLKTRNDTATGLVNGDIGVIRYVDAEFFEIGVEFNDELYIIDRDGLKDIRLAYAMTVHKSQGSEADNVIIPFPSAYEDLLTRNLLYTGVTRGKRTVCVIGAEETIRKCIENDPDENPKLMRHSTLEAHCRDLMANPPVYDVHLDEDEDDEWEPEPA
jgi:exodeoxyribonuclease V alpha subunit